MNPYLNSIAATQYRLQQYLAQHNSRKLASTAPEVEAKLTDAEQVEKTLFERAREIAKAIDLPYSDQNKYMLVILNQAHCRIGINVLEVKAIIPLESLTIVPGVPAHIAGVINMRGKILTLVNLEKFIQKMDVSQPDNYDRDCTVVITEISGMEFGLLSYGYPLISHYSPDNFTQALDMILDYHNEYISGIDLTGVIRVDLLAITNSNTFTVNQN